MLRLKKKVSHSNEAGQVLRVDAETLFDGVSCLVEFIWLQVGDAELAVRLIVVRVKFEHFFEVGDRGAAHLCNGMQDFTHAEIGWNGVGI